MPKLIILINAKQGLSPKEFRDYYEAHHAVLASRLLPMCKDYRRNYLDRSAWITRSDLPPLDADVITEMWFDTHADYQAFLDRIADPSIRAEILADEAKFLDQATVRMILVDECRTEMQ
jgi:uncharacterized protein (TIGR02118 family)